jgi:hypothetical protein
MDTNQTLLCPNGQEDTEKSLSCCVDLVEDGSRLELECVAWWDKSRTYVDHIGPLIFFR